MYAIFLKNNRNYFNIYEIRKCSKNSEVTKMALVPMLDYYDLQVQEYLSWREPVAAEWIDDHLTESSGAPVGLLLSWRRSTSPQPKSPRIGLVDVEGRMGERERWRLGLVGLGFAHMNIHPMGGSPPYIDGSTLNP